jgi:hypothetical protein
MEVLEKEILREGKKIPVLPVKGRQGEARRKRGKQLVGEGVEQGDVRHAIPLDEIPKKHRPQIFLQQFRLVQRIGGKRRFGKSSPLRIFREKPFRFDLSRSVGSHA